MSEIILPRRFKGQPQYAAPLDKGHPLYQDLLFAYSAGRGALDGRHPDLRGAVTGTVPYVFGLKGKGILPADGTSYLGFADNADYNWLGDITIIAQIKVGGTTVQQGIVTKCETTGGTNTPFGLFTEAGGVVSLNRSNNAGGPSFRVWASAAALSAGQVITLVVTQVADISVPPKFYINGVIDAGSATSLYGGTGTGAPTGNTTSIKLGNRTDLASRCYHEIYDVAIIKRVLSGGEVASAYGNFKDIWQAKPRRLWAVSAGGITLVGANSVEANTGSTGAITQAHALTGANSTQGNTGSSPAITQAQFLTGANSTQANASSTGSIAGGANLTIAPSAQANPSSTGAITQTHALVMAASVQDNIAAASVIVQAHILAGANSTQGNIGGTGAISLSSGNLIGAPSNQTNLGGTGVISMVGIVPDAFLDSMAVSTAIKKPGVPTGTPDWLKTLLEIILGRRGNKIAVPAEQNLTFSSTPTQAECQALYQYVNSVRSAVADLINRLDS